MCYPSPWDEKRQTTCATADLRALLRRLTADQSMRIRRRDERFKLNERISGDWRLRGFYSSYEDAEKRAEDLIRKRKRGA